MKKLFFATILFSSYQFTYAQLNKNSGFEAGDISNWWFETPVTYGAKEPGYVYSVVKDPSPGKNYVLQLASTENSEWCQLKQGILYKPSSSTDRLRVSASVKLDGNFVRSAGIALRTYGQGQDFGLTTKDLNRDTGWTKLSFEVQVQPKTDSLLLFCLMTGGGKAFFDDVIIEKVAVGTAKRLPGDRADVDLLSSRHELREL